MFEAVSALIGFALANWICTGEADIDPRNAGSARSLEKAASSAKACCASAGLLATRFLIRRCMV